MGVKPGGQSLFYVVYLVVLIYLFSSIKCDDDSDKIERWGHITVRPHAHMFWWLFYTTANVSSYSERPLLIWLQGGPGMPSSGYGVFLEIGPLDINLKRREHSWVKDFNLLFLDNPVGVGFSYFSKNTTYYASNNTEIAKDLVRFLEIFLNDNPEFQESPTYIFGESYGGKMAVDFAYHLKLRIRKGKINCNLKAVGLGDAFISPLDYASYYASVGYHLGLLDTKGYEYIEGKAEEIKQAVAEGNYSLATEKQVLIAAQYIRAMGGTDLYNFGAEMTPSSWSTLWKYHDELTALMNDKVKVALNISDEIKWVFMQIDAFLSLEDDFFRSVTDKVEMILNGTDLKVIVYNGVMDLIVNTVGTAKWLDDLKWSHREEWANATNKAFLVNNTIEGLVKEVENLSFYSVFRAGHSVPMDNPKAMDYILKPLKIV